MKYAIIGLGYIADRHLQAIHDTGGQLVAAYDPYTSVGKLDKYHKDCKYFNDIETFVEFLEKNRHLDVLSICSPNYLHFGHMRILEPYFDTIICEKPLVINKYQYECLKHDFQNIHPILQLRIHPEVKKYIATADSTGKSEIDICYETYRGDWYSKTWKADPEKSGGLIYNIGIHICDLLVYLFGKHKSVTKTKDTPDTIEFHFDLEYGQGKCRISTAPETKAIRRTMLIDGKVLDITKCFDDLHTDIYRLVNQDRWYDASCLKDTIDFVECIKTEPLRTILPEYFRQSCGDIA
jgi:UDP-N-acetyl-2-amino-2-deoxyglucuronate dehydrogenase